MKKKMKNEKTNEIVLAELGDNLLAEKVKLEEELRIIDRRVKDLDTKIKTKKIKEKEILNVHFFKFTAQNRGYKIMKRLEEINKELKDGK